MLNLDTVTGFKSSVKKQLIRWSSRTDNLSKTGSLNREYVRNQGTRKERLAYHELARTAKQHIFEARQKLADEYIRCNIEQLINRDFLIDSAQGIATTSLAGFPSFEAALTNARDLIARCQKDDLPSKGSLDFVASSKKDFDTSSAIANLALDPNLLIPVIRYFGILPILFGFDINRASRKRILRYSSHLYHLDPEDTTQIKVFIYLNDVDQYTGPFTALPGEVSAGAVQHLNYKVGRRLRDKRVYRAIGYGHEIVCTGPTGTTTFCDTNRCLHYGGRVQAQERYMITIYYALPTSTWFPLYPGDGERRNLIPLLRPTQNAPLEKAILGDDLVV